MKDKVKIYSILSDMSHETLLEKDGTVHSVLRLG